MAITIHISCIPSGSEDIIDNFNLQMDDSYCPADNVVCKAEDEDDEDAEWIDQETGVLEEYEKLN